MLSCGPSFSLLHWSGLEEDVQLMFDEIRVYPEHLVGCPCEDLDICYKEPDKLSSLSFLQGYTNEKETIQTWLI